VVRTQFRTIFHIRQELGFVCPWNERQKAPRREYPVSRARYCLHFIHAVKALVRQETSR
jgi:hypothetical protein